MQSLSHIHIIENKLMCEGGGNLAIIRQGSCIGVLYRPLAGSCIASQCKTYSGECHCVHNGRLVGAVNKLGNTLIHISRTLNTENLKSMDGVLLRHWNIRNSKNKNSIFLENLFIPTSRLETVRITPFRNLDRPVPPPGNPCSQPAPGTVRKPNTIYPGDCIGIRFQKVNHLWDIKNGKFLFWQKSGIPHCQWNTKLQNKPDRVWYAHWIVRKMSPHFQSVASNRGSASAGKETNITLHPITGSNPKEGTTVKITRLDHTSIKRILTYH